LIDLRECEQGDVVAISTHTGAYYFITFRRGARISDGWVSGLFVSVGNLSPRETQIDFTQNPGEHCVKAGVISSESSRIVIKASSEWPIRSIKRVVYTPARRVKGMTGRAVLTL